MKTDLLILAAGQGTRLKPLTKNIPKGLIKLHKISIIRNHLQIARRNNINNIYVVSGYKENKIKYKNIKKIYNKDYFKTNMLHSLYLGLKKTVNTNSDLIISYSDIIYNDEVFNRLINFKENISVVCDDNWKSYWELRFNNPLEDAETCQINKQNTITNIGQKTKTYSKINSQYIGLIKFKNLSKKKIYNLLHKEYLNRRMYSKILNHKYYSELFLTDLLQYLIKKKNIIKSLRINGNWLEIDSMKDYKIALKLTKKNKNCINIIR